MEPFPFSDDEWTRVKDVAISIVNASAAEDTSVAESLFEDLKEVLGELRDTYGEHPVLLETAADFASDPQESLQLYRQAAQLAEQHDLPANSIRVSLIELLISLASFEEAWQVLKQAEEEVEQTADTAEVDLLNELRSRLRNK